MKKYRIISETCYEIPETPGVKYYEFMVLSELSPGIIKNELERRSKKHNMLRESYEILYNVNKNSHVHALALITKELDILQIPGVNMKHAAEIRNVIEVKEDLPIIR